MIDGIAQKCCLVINEWNGTEEEAVTVPSHWSSKTNAAKSTPFLRREQKVMQSVEAGIISGSSLQDVYHQYIKSSGGSFRNTAQSNTQETKSRFVFCFNST